MNPALKDGACPCLRSVLTDERLRDFGPHDNGLGPDIPGRVDVGMGFVPTMPTPKFCLRGAVRFIDRAAGIAGPRRVARVDGHNLNPGNQRLVFDELPELEERPSMHTSPLPLAKPYPITDAIEVFKGDAATGAFGRRNERLGNAVVHVLSETSLTAADGLKTAANGSRALAFVLPTRSGPLKRAPRRGVALTASLDFVTGMQVTVAGGSDVRHAKVNTKEVGCWRLRAVREIDSHQQEPFAVAAADEIALPNGRAEALRLIAAHYQRHDNSAGQGQQRYPIKALEAHHVLIEWHRGEGSEVRALGLVPLIRLANLRDATHRHLRRKAKPLAQRRVMRFLERDLVGDLYRKRLSCQPIGTSVEGAQCRFKRSGLVLAREKLGLQRQFHTDTYRQNRSMRQQVSAFGGTPIPPRPEGRGISEKKW